MSDIYDQMDHMEQIINENKFSRKNIRKHIIEDIINTSELEDKFEGCVELIIKYCNKSYYASKNKRLYTLKQNMCPRNIAAELLLVTIPINNIVPIQGVAAKLGTIFGFDNIFEGVQTASEVIAICSSVDLYDLFLPRTADNEYLSIRSCFSLNETTLQFITDTKYLPPMTVKPNEINCNNDSGYLTIDSDSLILGAGNHHQDKLPLDVINIMNGTCMSLDETMLELEETSKKPLDTPEKLENFNRMKISSRRVYDDLIKQGNKFYNCHKVDKRLRLYSQGYQCHIQATSYKKSLINLHKKELIV